MSFLPEWHRIVAERDLDGLAKVLAPDVTMGAPPYWTPLEGHDIVHHLLGLIVTTIEDFSYHREWQQDRELALEFKGHLGDTLLQGIDLITLSPSEQIQHLDVLIRPANALEELRTIIAPQMTAFLQAHAVRCPAMCRSTDARMSGAVRSASARKRSTRQMNMPAFHR